MLVTLGNKIVLNDLISPKFKERSRKQRFGVMTCRYPIVVVGNIERAAPYKSGRLVVVVYLGQIKIQIY